MKTTIKIPIIGIDNSGKTSIILTFQREFKALSKIKPTKGVDRTVLNFMNKEIIIWDMAGQFKYRKRHIKRAEQNFSDIEDCFFVIDIQDQDSFTDSINYFQLVRTALMEYAPATNIHILINKMDPGMEKDGETLSLSKTISKKFSEMAQPLNSYVYLTSIFNPISIIHSLSRAILGQSILIDNFGVIFSDFVEKNDFVDIISFIMIYTIDFVEIGSYFSSDVKSKTMRDVAHEIFKSFDEKKFKLMLADFSLKSGNITIQIIRFELNNKNYFFIYGFKGEGDLIQNLEAKTIKNKAEELLNEVKKMMLYF